MNREIWLFIGGAFLGALFQVLIQPPWEDLVEKRFSQWLGLGIYKHMGIAKWSVLLKNLQHALKTYDFKYAHTIIDKMEWFVTNKTKKERGEATKAAQNDYEKDLKNIRLHKGVKEPHRYVEDTNKWVRNGKKKKRSSPTKT